jgi:PAS domain S-box-containing protein
MPETTLDILLVEDEKAHVELIQRAFASHPEKTAFHVVHTLKEASALIQKQTFDIVLLDFLLPDGKGIDLLPRDKEDAPCPFMLMTSHGDEKLAVDALKAGALNYVVKSAENLAAMPALASRVLREWKLIQERRKAEEALRLSEEKFRTIADYSMDMGIWLGVDGKLLWINRSVEKLTGYTLQECMNSPDHFFSFIHEADRLEIKHTFVNAVAQKTSGNNIPFRFKRKDESIRWASVSWQPIYSNRNEYLGIRASVRDIHELKSALEKLEEANQELDAFVYTVSHDLRTPLTPIIGYAQLLRKQYGEILDDNANEFLLAIAQQGENMLNLLEDLLRLARVGFLERPKKAVEAQMVVQEVIDSLNGQYSDVEIKIQKDTLPAVHLPRTLLTQVFENLIKNALVYGRKKGSPIEIGGDRKGGMARFFVRDHGLGIPDDEKTKIFEVFYRAGREENSQGTGVGLATVRKIARQYGGLAWVEDTSGGGATFWFSLEDVAEGTSLN